MANQKNPSTESIPIDWAKLDSITVYEITEDELTIIEGGSASSNYLNFSIALLTVFVSFLITLLTTTISNTRTFIFFLITAIVTAILGTLLFILWLGTRKSASNIFVKIRARKNSTEVRQAIENLDQPSPEQSESSPSI